MNATGLADSRRVSVRLVAPVRVPPVGRTGDLVGLGHARPRGRKVPASVARCRLRAGAHAWCATGASTEDRDHAVGIDLFRQVGEAAPADARRWPRCRRAPTCRLRIVPSRRDDIPQASRCVGTPHCERRRSARSPGSVVAKARPVALPRTRWWPGPSSTCHWNVAEFTSYDRRPGGRGSGPIAWGRSTRWSGSRHRSPRSSRGAGLDADPR